MKWTSCPTFLLIFNLKQNFYWIFSQNMQYISELRKFNEWPDDKIKLAQFYCKLTSLIHDKIISSDNGSSLYLHNITTAHAGRYTINSRSFNPKCFEFIFYSYTCTADNGVGNPVTEEVLLTVLCKYINKLQSRYSN